MKKIFCKRTVLAPFFILSVLLSFSALAQSQNHLKSYPLESWELQFQSSFFNSTANYLSTGDSYQNLTKDNYYRLTLFDVGIRKIFSSKWSLGFSNQIAAGESQTLSLKRTNSAVTQSKFFSDFVVFDGKFNFILEPFVTYPWVRNDLTTDAMAISEGAIELGSLVRLQTSFAKVRWGLFSGFNYRDQGRSSLVPYGTAAEVKLGSVLLGGEISGYRSIGFDKNTSSDTDRVNWSNRVNAGSYKFYSVNPSSLESRFWTTFLVDPRFWLKIGAGMTLNGSSTASGWEAFGQIQWRFKTSDTAVRASSEVQRFRADTEDGVDQNLFHPTSEYSESPKKLKSVLQDELDQTEAAQKIPRGERRP